MEAETDEEQSPTDCWAEGTSKDETTNYVEEHSERFVLGLITDKLKSRVGLASL